jgi:glycosyltransferase involved in cell wall biosynthesis
MRTSATFTRMNPHDDSQNLAAKLMGCLVESVEKRRARDAIISSALQKTLQRYSKRESRWLKKTQSVIESIEKRLSAKGPMAALSRLFFRRSHRVDRDILAVLRELLKRDRDQYVDLCKLGEAVEKVGPGTEVRSQPSDGPPPAGHGSQQSTLVMLDLRSVDASGINGGLQTYVIWLIKWLCAKHRKDFRFLGIARWTNHELVASLLGGEDAVLVEADHSQILHTGTAHAPATLTTSVPLDELAARMDVDVLYCPFGPLAFQREGMRAIVLIADLLHRELPEFLTPETRFHREQYLRRAMEGATLFQCISRSSQERLEHHFPATLGKTFFTYLPVQDRLGSPAGSGQEGAPGGRQPYFFYPANFWPHKNHRILLVAFQIYVAEAGGTAWDLVLTGSDYEGQAAEIQRLAEGLGIDHKVRMTGYVSDAELAELWREAGALVFPSLHEGFGIPLLEAMRHRVPILCGPDYSLNEIAGDAALYFNPRKPIQIAARMKELAENPDLVERLRSAGTERLARFRADDEAELVVTALKGGIPVRDGGKCQEVCGGPT